MTIEGFIDRGQSGREPLAVEPLLSKYLGGGFANEGLTLEGFVWKAGSTRADARWRVHRPFPNEAEFHLAAQSSLLVLQQTGVALCMLELGFREKTAEVWLQHIEMDFLTPITRSTFGCQLQLIGHQRSTPPRVVRHVFEFRARIDSAYRATGLFFVDLPEGAP